MTIENEVKLSPDLETTCKLLDKMTLKHLYLMEDKLRYELNIESSINNGSYQLAKSRYIMGQTSISATKLPTEGSPEFSASTVCESTEEDGVTQLRAAKSERENTVNPMHWFGVLVPQNLHLAKGIFQNAINHVVECVNVQLQIVDNMKNISILQLYKSILQKSS
ncbi:hypothetical protein O0L34_g17270 [Tuta absoluta]|nr:hypothetical protein O0L34_g17270 [Tuta absoluta]